MQNNEDQVRLKGQDWFYDAELGVYRPVDPPESLWSKWAWIVAVVVLAVVCWLLER